MSYTQIISEACSTMRALGVLSERKRSPRCLQALAIQFDRCIARNSKMATKTIMGFVRYYEFLFLDSIIRMTMYVSLCGYMKWNNINWR